MYRKKINTKFILIILWVCVLSYLLVSINVFTQALEVDNLKLVLDSTVNNKTIPKDFRKTSDLSKIKNIENFNIKGLDKLNISGSQQFSGYNLSTLIKEIGTLLPITVVDLRQESHGFINGFSVSWVNSKNNANQGLTRDQVLNEEADKLISIKLNEPITLYNHANETIIPTIVQDEKQLVSSELLNYYRIPVTDGEIPTNDMVDYFIEFVKNQPKESWIHFHCKEGIGRTGIFMIMYDMLKNYKVASADEITKRQVALANYNEKVINSFYTTKRIEFLNKFYDYCKKNGDTFNIKWNEWVRNVHN